MFCFCNVKQNKIFGAYLKYIKFNPTDIWIRNVRTDTRKLWYFPPIFDKDKCERTCDSYRLNISLKYRFKKKVQLAFNTEDLNRCFSSEPNCIDDLKYKTVARYCKIITSKLTSNQRIAIVKWTHPRQVDRQTRCSVQTDIYMTNLGHN